MTRTGNNKLIQGLKASVVVSSVAIEELAINSNVHQEMTSSFPLI